MPQNSSRLPWPLSRLGESYTQFLRRISYPIQNFFGRSDLAFRLSLHAWLTPLWSRLAHFKGQNARSVGDVTRYLGQRERRQGERPLFLFLNLMETHLPFWPPGEFVDRVAPYFRRDQEAQRLMAAWNREAFRWAAPTAPPLADLERRVLSDMYDAEVAYQDDYLGQLFAVLNGRRRHKDTLTIIVSDHGDGLGEHNYFGHAFVAYQELVHVPLLLQWPRRLPQSGRISAPVSTRRLYHTTLEAAGCASPSAGPVPGMEDVGKLTLLHTIEGRDPEQRTAFSEVYPPLNFVRAIESYRPELIAPYRCLSLRRAIVREDATGLTRKLIHVDDTPDELFDLTADPLELHDEMRRLPAETAVLDRQLNWMTKIMEQQRDNLTAGGAIELEDDQLLQRLRGLGYVE